MQQIEIVSDLIFRDQCKINRKM